MNIEPTQPTPDSAAAGAEPRPADSSPTAAPAALRRPPLWLLTLGAGLLSGLISWLGGESALTAFPVEGEMVYPEGYKQLSGYQRQARAAEIEGAAIRAAEQKKAMVGFGLLGLTLGLELGLIGGWASASPRRAASGAIGGGLVGAAVGGALSWAAVPLFFRFYDPEIGLMILFLTLATIFVGIGGASGLALGLGLGGRPAMARTVPGGLVGGLIGTFALATVYSLAFPLMRTQEPIASEWTPRLLMYLCAAAGIGLATGLAAIVRSGESRAEIA